MPRTWSKTVAVVAAAVTALTVSGCWPYDARMDVMGADSDGASVASGGGSPAAPGDATPSGAGSATAGEPSSAASGVLSAAETATLLWMVEEEKLAHDVYVVLGEQYDVPIFDNIAESETRHHDAVAGLLDTYAIDDPTDGADLGEFDDPALQALYDQLVAQGSQSLADAFAVGVLIEETDITDLQTAIDESTRTDIDLVYGNLLEGSRNHLEAFLSR